jgi:TIR domain-containing protein
VTISRQSQDRFDPGTTGPSVFISYAHEDKGLATALASSLRTLGCRVWIDQDGMRIGDRLIDRIAGAIEDMDFLLALVSKASVKSSWCQRELSLAMTGELASAHIKVLPVRLGNVPLPLSLRDVYSPRVEPGDVNAMANQLVRDMVSHEADRTGAKPSARIPVPSPQKVPNAPVQAPNADPSEPIRILGIDADHVGRPRNDGERGSALYEVPLRLNRRPSPLWTHVFRAVWDRPPRFTTMHRPGIASVSGDRIILDGTTIDEIDRYHAETLRHVIPEVNRQVAEFEAEQKAKQDRDEANRMAHEEAVREAAKRVSFD